jgi:acyl-CoA synthetase (NDP forming)
MKSFRDLEFLLYPQSIAVVGATNNPMRVGARIIENTKRVGFKGKLFPVNPKYQELYGYKCYPTLSEIPEPVDNVWIALPNESVLSALKEAEEKNIKVATVYSSGWGEIGTDGQLKEKELRNWLSNQQIRFLGPNTIGMGNTYSKVISGFNSSMNFFKFDYSGDIGFVSQSGAMVGGMVGRAEERSIELGYYVHTGNEIDIDMIDVIEFMIHDDKIKVILGYIEGIRDTEKFVRVAQLAHQKNKPLIFYKTGVSEKGKKVVASHTGAISGSNKIYNAIFKQFGIIRVANHEELFEVGSLFSRFLKCKPANRGRLLVFTPSGGAGSIFADKCEELGIELSEIGQKTREGLSKILPSYTVPANPLDIGGGVFSDPSMAGRCLDIVCQDPNVDILTWTLVGPPRSPLTAKMIQDFITVSKIHKKPTAVHTLAGHLNDEGFKIFMETNSPTFDSIESCVRAIKYYLSYQSFINNIASLKSLNSNIKPVVSQSFEAATKILKNAPKGALSEFQSKKILSLYQIPIPKGDLAFSLEEAKKIASTIQYPVVLKVSTSDILHKTEAGIVVLDVKNHEMLENSYREVLNNAISYKPDAKIEGVIVEEMIVGGIETIVGMIRDPQFGPAVMFGLGGIIVEIFKDVSLRVAPFNQEDARSMISEIKTYELLKGFRGQQKANIDAIIDVIMKVQQLSWELKQWISEIDINPLAVFSNNQEVKALDALIRIT